MAKKKRMHQTGHFIQVPSRLLYSPAYRVLGPSAKALFFDLRIKFKGNNNGNIEAVMSDLRHLGWSSPVTLATALFELRALGFLVQTRAGGIGRGKKVPSLYRFTDLPSQPFAEKGIAASPATLDFMQYRSLAAANEALKNGVARLRAEAKGRAYPKKKQLQKLSDTTTEPVA